MSIKVVPGQLELWQMAAEMSRYDKSQAATAFRDYVAEVARNQSIAPDVVPNEVHVTPPVDETGKFVKFIA